MNNLISGLDHFRTIVGILSGRTSLAKTWLEQLRNDDKTMLWDLVPVQVSICTLSLNWKNMTVDNTTCQSSVILTVSPIAYSSSTTSNQGPNTVLNPF